MNEIFVCYVSNASFLAALSSRGTLILEAALKRALQVLNKAVQQQDQLQHDCRGCTHCLFPECVNKTTQCREMNMVPASEPTCEVILAAQAEADPLERSWALSHACSFYQQFCPQGNYISDMCIEAMAGHCHLKLQECKLETDMDYLNTSPENEDMATCGQTLPPIRNSTEISGRIVGGSATSQESWPWLVNIRLNGELMCGGVLLGDVWVLTAAHCFAGDINELHWTVVIGQYDLSKKDDGAKIFNVNRIVSHPKFNQKTFNNDLALLELTSAVTEFQRARPVCLPEMSKDPIPGTNCFIAGWGSLYEDGPLSDVVMEARVPVLSQEICKNTLGKDMLTGTMFCAGYLTGGIDSCQGDSGGPLTCQDPVSKRYSLYGITSWGDGCGERGKPGVYTRVTAFTEWISVQMKKSLPSREPTCFELGGMEELQDNDKKSEIRDQCLFYRQSCPGPMSQEACSRYAEEKCRQKQRRCELRSYLKSLLDLLRRAEDFLRNNMNFSFFTQTIPQFMEEMYNNIVPSRIRRDVQAASLPLQNTECRRDRRARCLSQCKEVGPHLASIIQDLELDGTRFKRYRSTDFGPQVISNVLFNDQHGEILVDLGSKNLKGLYKARIRVCVAGKSTTFISLVGMESNSFFRSMPGIIALSLDALKT
ncbi:serine protease 56 [Pelobates cultripes]|uniref:Serine protease 56 n=1 Tax=Pelobates cultripes TaxID=61616 RepID=A0AAD1RCE6_PELCU|nr:serine protease 56 [Pelobates cultripes]